MDKQQKIVDDLFAEMERLRREYMTLSQDDRYDILAKLNRVHVEWAHESQKLRLAKRRKK